MTRNGKEKQIILLTHYPSVNELLDGYFQRVMAVDKLFVDTARYYVDYDSGGWIPRIGKIGENLFEIKTSRYNPLGLFLILRTALESDLVYLHSVFRLRSGFHRLLFSIAKMKIVDLHGAVPEELAMNGKNGETVLFEKVERFAVRRADVIVSVSHVLGRHIRKKHGVDDGRIIVLPIFSGLEAGTKGKVFSKRVIYCGGMQKWQQVGKMLEYVHTHKDHALFTFLVPDPEAVRSEYRAMYGEAFPGTVESVDPAGLADRYAEHSFGLVLREDILLNNVACPTKLVEYLQHGIVPIVDSENIGDFREFGYETVSYRDDLPGESRHLEMTEVNRLVAQKFQDTTKHGIRMLKEFVGQSKRV